MNSIDSEVLNRLARRAMVATGAVLLFAGTMACGGDSSPSSPYHSICQVQKDCLDDEFDKTYGTVNGCAQAMKANAEVSNKSGTCLQSTEATFECRADAVLCRNNEIEFDGQCESEAKTQRNECGPETPTTDDFESVCEQAKECLGSDFEQQFGSVEQCISDYEDIRNQSDDMCKQLMGDAMICLRFNFLCDQGSVGTPDECSQQIEDFSSQCST